MRQTLGSPLFTLILILFSVITSTASSPSPVTLNSRFASSPVNSKSTPHTQPLRRNSIAPARTRSHFPLRKRSNHVADIGNGWSVFLTGDPHIYMPIQQACEALEELYQIVIQTNVLGLMSGSTNFDSDYALGVGDFILAFQAEDTIKPPLVPWPVIVSFCQFMQIRTRRGWPLKYSGALMSITGAMIYVQLGVLGEGMDVSGWISEED
ncbi:hypothetical protein MMC28_007665 [Mycoblastus sanguinarius]|nr:hypothetical protein [Mycoblastus sanguinarius]